MQRFNLRQGDGKLMERNWARLKDKLVARCGIIPIGFWPGVGGGGGPLSRLDGS